MATGFPRSHDPVLCAEMAGRAGLAGKAAFQVPPAPRGLRQDTFLWAEEELSTGEGLARTPMPRLLKASCLQRTCHLKVGETEGPSATAEAEDIGQIRSEEKGRIALEGCK